MNSAASNSISTERRFQLLVEAVTDYAIYLLEPDGTISSWNSGAQRIKGYAASEVLGTHFSRFFTDEDRAAGKPQRALEIAGRTGRFEDEAWRVRKDGTRFWALAVLDAVKDEAGRLIGFAKVTRDITERRAAQQALQDSERRFRMLVEGVVDYAIFMLDPGGHVVNWNAGAQRIKGYTTAEIVGEHFSRFYTPQDRAGGLPARALATAEQEGKYEAEGWRLRNDGTRFWASVVIDAIRDETGKLVGYAKVTRDITERREAQRQLEHTREQLLQSQKLEAIGQLTGGIAHDFNNLLTVVMGGAGMAERLAGNDDKLKRLIRNIRHAAERGEALTKQLLAFSRRQTLQPDTIDLTRQMELIAELLARSLRDDIELVIDPSPGLWAVEVDVNQLELAILNVGLNARDAMPEGGTLRLTARNALLSGEIAGLSGSYVMLSIADTGTGIPDAIKHRVFEPFFTTKGSGKGSGLGLSQAFGFASQSGGTLTLESERGRGTTVNFYLPANPDWQPAAVESRPADITPAKTRASILLVEDDPAIAELAMDLLDEAGYRVEVVGDAGAALETLRNGGHHRVDAVFSDIMMPGGMNGAELAQVIRREYPHIAVLLTTGYAEAAARAAVSGFPLIPKPYESKALIGTLSRLLAQSRSA